VVLDRAVIEWLTRSQVSPTSVAATGALTQVQLNFLPSLVPVSAAAAVLSRTIELSLVGVSSASCPAVSLPTAGWVGEGSAIPVLQRYNLDRGDAVTVQGREPHRADA